MSIKKKEFYIKSFLAIKCSIAGINPSSPNLTTVRNYLKKIKKNCAVLPHLRFIKPVRKFIQPNVVKFNHML